MSSKATHGALACASLVLGLVAAFVWECLRPPPAVLWLQGPARLEVREKTFAEPRPSGGVRNFSAHQADGFRREGSERLSPGGAVTTWGRLESVGRGVSTMGGAWTRRPRAIERRLWTMGLPVRKERYVFDARSETVDGARWWGFVLYRAD